MSNYLYDLTRDVLSAAKAAPVLIAFSGVRPAAVTSHGTWLTRQTLQEHCDDSTCQACSTRSILQG
jgi:hypothetical protein